MLQYIMSSYVNERDNNEDCCLSFEITVPDQSFRSNSIKILLLSDGMGGHQHGELVSHKVIDNVATQISQRIFREFTIPKLKGDQHSALENIDFTKLLQESISITNDKILKLIKTNKWKKAGATLVAVIVVGQIYYWGYLGDSRLYHWIYSEEKLLQITEDHSVVGIMLKEGAITEEVAKYHSQKHELVYYMGIERIPSKEKVKFVGKGSLKEGDILFLCSDGICGKPENEEFGNIFSNFLNNDETIQVDSKAFIDALKHLALEKNESDNQTLILYSSNSIFSRSVEEIKRTTADHTKEVDSDDSSVVDKGKASTKPSMDEELVSEKTQENGNDSVLSVLDEDGSSNEGESLDEEEKSLEKEEVDPPDKPEIDGAKEDKESPPKSDEEEKTGSSEVVSDTSLDAENKDKSSENEQTESKDKKDGLFTTLKKFF